MKSAGAPNDKALHLTTAHPHVGGHTKYYERLLKSRDKTGKVRVKL